MCTTDDPAGVTPAEALPSDAEWKGEVLPLEPVDELSVLTVCDNTADMLLPDQGPATRMSLARMRKESPDLEVKGPPHWRGDPDLAKVALIHLTPRTGRGIARRERGGTRPSAGGANNLRRPADGARSKPGAAWRGDPLAADARGAALRERRRGGRDCGASDGRWTEAMRESYADRIERRLAGHIENWAEIKLARRAYSPADLEIHEHQSRRRRSLRRRLRARPVLPLAPIQVERQSRAYVPNVYHIGASTHPGPGLGGVSGFLLASSLQ